ncbi:MAG: T9SS type A sorting domain-containing protein, partial [Ignavibacteriae bacterium]|nr:T9SS type A sorting domain-containing protein [Ignavibacteriota bacterium]
AHDVEVGDLNGDGKLDIVVRLGSLVIFYQNNPNSWTAVTANSRSSEGTALGDIDGDGDLDIAINGYWLENPKPATSPWTERLINSSWPSMVGVHIADVNGDGRKDVLLAPSESASGKLAWYESTAPRTGSWTEHVIDNTVSYIHTFKTADMDRDGDLDVVTAEMHQAPDPDEVSVYRNEGGALNWTQVVAGTTGSHNIRVADIGNDGDIDIIGANWNNGAPGGAPITMWENLGGSSSGLPLDSWRRHVIDSNKPWRAVFITAADLDGDSRKDILTGGWWYKNPGSPAGSWTRNTIGSPLNNMAAVYDFDGNGTMDVLGTQGQGANANANFVWARNNGSGSFTMLNNIQSGQGDFLQGTAVGRFQGGALEVALSWHESNRGVQSLTVPANPSSSTWTWKRLTTTSQDEQVSAGDIDRDGDLDLALGTQWLRNDGSSWSAFTLNGSSGLPDRNRVADINRDGRLDVVVGFEAISTQGKLAWYEAPSSATSTWTEHIISSTTVGPMSLDVGDLDADGDIDVVVGEHNLSNPASARMLVFENVSNGASWVQHVVYTGEEHHDGAQIADIDNDGDLDIISIGWDNPRVVLYENLASVTSAGALSAGMIAPPSEFKLYQNYPNPFNPTTTIRYDIPETGSQRSEDSRVTLKVFDLIGREVAVLVNENAKPGSHSIRFDARNLVSGTYLYRLTTGQYQQTGKMLLVR